MRTLPRPNLELEISEFDPLMQKILADITKKVYVRGYPYMCKEYKQLEWEPCNRYPRFKVVLIPFDE